MKRIPHQLMELNSTFIWHWPWFIQGVKSAKQHGFTGIILHQQELLSVLATPSALSQKLNVENLIHQQNYALQYLIRVDRYLAENNLSFWLQGEAAPDDDIIKRKFPELTFDEKSAPDFWHHFYAAILHPLLHALPHLSGLILSMMSGACCAPGAKSSSCATLLITAGRDSSWLTFWRRSRTTSGPRLKPRSWITIPALPTIRTSPLCRGIKSGSSTISSAPVTAGPRCRVIWAMRSAGA